MISSNFLKITEMTREIRRARRCVLRAQNSRIVLSSKKELEGPSVCSRKDSVESAEGILKRQVGADVQLRVKK